MQLWEIKPWYFGFIAQSFPHRMPSFIPIYKLSLMLRATIVSEAIFSGTCSTNKAGFPPESVISAIGHKVGDGVYLRGQWKIDEILNLLDLQKFNIVLWTMSQIHQVMLAICYLKFSDFHIWHCCFPLFLSAIFQKHA